jgi:DNA-binding NarL/FixJ family response regulator
MPPARIRRHRSSAPDPDPTAQEPRSARPTESERETPSPWLLPEDGIVDEIAVEIAASGIRQVALTPTERRLAVAEILARGGTPKDVAARLHISDATARALVNQVRAQARRAASRAA